MSSYIKKRVPKKKSTEPDEILTATRQLSDRLKDNMNLIIYSVGAVVFLAVVSLGMMWIKNKKVDSAATALLEVQSSYSQKLEAVQTEEAEIDPEALRESLAGFREVMSEYPDMLQGKSAALYAANILFRLGSYQQAADVVEELISKDPVFANELNAPYLMARSLEGAGDFRAAVEAYLKILDGTREDLRALLMMDIARCHELSGDSDSAIEVYKSILDQYQDSVFAFKADTKLAILGIQAEGAL